jgi:hypothetical protein
MTEQTRAFSGPVSGRKAKAAQWVARRHNGPDRRGTKGGGGRSQQLRGGRQPYRVGIRTPSRGRATRSWRLRSATAPGKWLGSRRLPSRRGRQSSLSPTAFFRRSPRMRGRCSRRQRTSTRSPGRSPRRSVSFNASLSPALRFCGGRKRRTAYPRDDGDRPRPGRCRPSRKEKVGRSFGRRSA